MPSDAPTTPAVDASGAKEWIKPELRELGVSATASASVPSVADSELTTAALS